MAATRGGVYVYVFDRRDGNGPGKRLCLQALTDAKALLAQVFKEFELDAKNKCVVSTTSRQEITEDSNLKDLLAPGDTLYILNTIGQELCAPVEERVEYLPHYDTLVKSGMYEYYTSEGQNPLPFAFAELIDNSLAATAGNMQQRMIEVKLFFDGDENKNAVCVFDNGKGMTSKDLNNWAIYRLSKFTRRKRGNHDSSINDKEAMPRYLNSDISYFGVGGKQAVFYIGNCSQVITKSATSKDVHEICLSYEDFKRKEEGREEVYSGFIRNRRVGDASWSNTDDGHLSQLIKDEKNYKSFTNVYVTGIKSDHVKYLKSNFKILCRQLAHIYHYYLHGPSGNTEDRQNSIKEKEYRGITITVELYEKGKKCKLINLKEIVKDVHTQFVRSAGGTFEFKIHVEGSGIVEGIIRYHPFLYDRETYPLLKESDHDESGTDDDDYRDSRFPRGNRAIFECYWNGRLIPYTTIDCLDWCMPARKTGVPNECFYRTSGVLFTDDAFQVSTNKLTFTDLEMKLKEKGVLFTRVDVGQEKKVNPAYSYRYWLQECHKRLDKQIKFKSNLGHFVHGKKTNSVKVWTEFKCIEWGNRTITAGTLVSIRRTKGNFLGTVTRFILKDKRKENEFYSTNGLVEIVQEPSSIWGEKKMFPLSKLNLALKEEDVKALIAEEESKLPSKLALVWPDGGSVHDGDTITAGTAIGPIKVDIINNRGESVNVIPGDKGKKLLVELVLIFNSTNNHGEVLSRYTCQHGGNSWHYWFRKMGAITTPGQYTIKLVTVLSDVKVDSTQETFLPRLDLNFTVTEGDPYDFTIEDLKSPIRVGVPFKVGLHLMDAHKNAVIPKVESFNPLLSVQGAEVSYSNVFTKNSTLFIKDVTVNVYLERLFEKEFQLKVTLPSLSSKSKSVGMKVIPGLPAKLIVTPPEDEIEIENDTHVNLSASVVDGCGNVTINKKQTVGCWFTGLPYTIVYSVNCSVTGEGTLTGGSIDIKGLKDVFELKAEIDLMNRPGLVEPVKKTVWVTPSRRPTQFEVFYQPKGSDLKEKMTNEQYIPCVAGEVISGLAFRLLNEGNRLLNIDDMIASKIKVNWTAKIPRDDVKLGFVPEVKAPTSTSETKFCLISLMSKEAIVEFSFYLKPTFGPPHFIQCSSLQSKLRLGQKLENDIKIEVTDAYRNHVDLDHIDLEGLSVNCIGLDQPALKVVVHKKEYIVIKGIAFTDNTLGTKELCITWKDLQCYHRLEVVAGPPHAMRLVDNDYESPIAVINGQKFPIPIRIQLVDACGFPSNEASVRVSLHRDAGLKLQPPPLQQISDQNGCVEFQGFTVSGIARGNYCITPKASVGGSALDGPVIRVYIEPDKTKPVSLHVTFEKEDQTIIAGEKLPELSAYILAEDDNPMLLVKSTEISLKSWYIGEKSPEKSPPFKAITYHASQTRLADDKPGTFYFRDISGPQKMGRYCLTALYMKEGKVQLTSPPLTANIKAGPPIKLMPVTNVDIPTVSNIKRASSRQLLNEFSLQLEDEYGNPSGTNQNGFVDVMIVSDGHLECPVLDNGRDSNRYQLINGVVTIDTLNLKINCAGADGQEYLLKFIVKLGSEPCSLIEPYSMPFLFYNDMEKQEKMAKLARERNTLIESIRNYRALFNTTAQLVTELQETLELLKREEDSIIDDLRKAQFYDIHTLTTEDNIESTIVKLSERKNTIQQIPRRLCRIGRGAGGKGIIGKVAHLAQVEDDDVARVLSWHLSSDMDCMVTTTSEQAKRIYKETNGKQQVLPLDSVFKKSLPEWNKMLPHEKCRGFKPPGRPVYARRLLNFPEYEKECQTVFLMLLGDTIIIDTLEDANSYRCEVVKHCYCPTILTKTGERIRSNGKFGGTQNHAPPIGRMQGAIFSAPIPSELERIAQQIGLLKGLKQVIYKKRNAKSDLEHQKKFGQSEDMRSKYKDCLETEGKLQKLESCLGLTPVSHEAPKSPGIFNTIESSVQALSDASVLPFLQKPPCKRRHSLSNDRLVSKKQTFANNL